MLEDKLAKVIITAGTDNPNNMLLENAEKATEDSDGKAVEESVTGSDSAEPDSNLPKEDISAETAKNAESSDKSLGKQEESITEETEITEEIQIQEQIQEKGSNINYLIMSGLLLAALFVVLLLFASKRRKMRKAIVLQRESKTHSPYGTMGKKTVKVIKTSDRCPVNVASVHDVGRRSMQQDSFGISDLEGDDFKEKGVMAIVADGMGGLSDGERMSQLVVISMLQGFDEDNGQMPAASLLLKLVDEANEAVNEELGDDKIGKCGSTLTAVIVKQNKLSWISVGDSHIYVYRSGKLFKMNRDHNYAAELDEKAERGELSWDEAMTDPQRAALTSFIGMGKLELVDQNENPIALQQGDRILLMSDGIFGTVEEDRIAQLMKLPLKESCKKLEEEIHIRNKGNQDNFTCVILDVKYDGEDG